MKGGLPAFGGRIRPQRSTEERQQLTARRQSKKSYTGTVAGIGRPVSRGIGRGSSGALPAGPAAHRFQSVQLPKRGSQIHPAVTRPPSLMTRIRGRLSRAAAALGF